MDFPVYDMQAILPKPVVDWSAEIAQQYRVHPTVVLNALLMYQYLRQNGGEAGRLNTV